MSGTLSDREVVRIAVNVQDQLRERRLSRYGLARRQTSELAFMLQELQAAERRLGLCVGRRWDRAAGRILDEARRLLRNLPYQVTCVERAIAPRGEKVPSLRDIVAEIKAAEDEFGDLQFDRKTNRLSGITDAIELEEVFRAKAVSKFIREGGATPSLPGLV